MGSSAAVPFLTRWVPRHWFARSLIVLTGVSAGLLIGCRQTILSSLGDYLVSTRRPQSADLILVLAGDFWGPRVVKGADLAIQHYAPLVLISGTPYNGRPDGELAIEFLVRKGYPSDLFKSFGHHAKSTIEEAIALRPELARRGVKSVLLVTSAHHSRRAGIVFHLFCPGIQFIPISAPDTHYRQDHWWQDPSSRKLFFSEWSKIFGTVLFVYPEYRLERFLKREKAADPTGSLLNTRTASSKGPVTLLLRR